MKKKQIITNLKILIPKGTVTSGSQPQESPKAWEDVFRKLIIEVFMAGIAEENQEEREIFLENLIKEKSKVFSQLLEAQKQEIITEFTEGKRCLTCGKIFDNQGGLADTCEDCFETN
jgi:hypothetical protein